MTMFTDFASSTSLGRTAVVTTQCRVCGVIEKKTVEVNDFNSWAYRYDGITNTYSEFALVRHGACIGKPDRDLSSMRERIIQPVSRGPIFALEQKRDTSFVKPAFPYSTTGDITDGNDNDVPFFELDLDAL